MIVSKMELLTVFGLFAPYLIFIGITGIISNYYAFLYISKSPQTWKIEHANYPLPIGLLKFAIFLEQSLIILFCWNLMENGVSTFIISMFLVCDLVFILSIVRNEKVRSMEKSVQQNLAMDDYFSLDFIFNDTNKRKQST